MGYINQAIRVAWYLLVVLVGATMWQNPEVLSSDIQGGGSENTVKASQRRLLADTLGNISVNGSTGLDTGSNSGTWPYLLAALITTLAISLFIVMAVKCRFFQSYLASYRHRLLPEGDTISQCSRSLEVGFAPQSVMVCERVCPRRVHEDGDDDDDGFIEDNYIQAGERERAEREREQQRRAAEQSDDDLDLDLDLEQFTIG